MQRSTNPKIHMPFVSKHPPSEPKPILGQRICILHIHPIRLHTIPQIRNPNPDRINIIPFHHITQVHKPIVKTFVRIYEDKPFGLEERSDIQQYVPVLLVVELRTDFLRFQQ